tara:strand:- start:47975 stop:48322 length:348 start_codon:yes stop_codon:yes gene_type:complete
MTDITPGLRLLPRPITVWMVTHPAPETPNGFTAKLPHNPQCHEYGTICTNCAIGNDGMTQSTSTPKPQQPFVKHRENDQIDHLSRSGTALAKMSGLKPKTGGKAAFRSWRNQDDL